MCLAIPGIIISRDASDEVCPMGQVQFGPLIKEVCLAYTPEAHVGDYVLVHVGFTIAKLNSEHAQSILATFHNGS